MPFFPDVFQGFAYGLGPYGAGGYGGPGTQGFIDYYVSLLTSEYQGSPNLIAWLTALITPFADAGLLLSQWASDFDIDAAVGPQLDILGQIIGAARLLPFQPTGGANPLLSDTDYRALLKATLGKNNWNGKIASMYPLWATIYPGGVIQIQDNQDMTANISLGGALTQIQKDMINHDMIIPRPEGVRYNFTFPSNIVFGYDAVNSTLTGYDVGHWV